MECTRSDPAVISATPLSCPPTSSRRATPTGTARMPPCRTAAGRRRRPFRRTRPRRPRGLSCPPAPASTCGHCHSTRLCAPPTSPPAASY
uniref:Uncharacterized protein n=1 Tax=Arundo donax TaxID=35708 RepID=A0A0A8Z7W0_ARUDO